MNDWLRGHINAAEQEAEYFEDDVKARLVIVDHDGNESEFWLLPHDALDIRRLAIDDCGYTRSTVTDFPSGYREAALEAVYNRGKA